MAGSTHNPGLMGGLALAALLALRQRYRVRRSFTETTQPEPGLLPRPSPHVSIILPVHNSAVTALPAPRRCLSS